MQEKDPHRIPRRIIGNALVENIDGHTAHRPDFIYSLSTLMLVPARFPPQPPLMLPVTPLLLMQCC